MEGDVIKSFLVGLGFGVDEASLAKFNKSIAEATLKVAALYASVKIAATGIAYGISKVSDDFERMGYEYHIIAPAINKALLLRRELLKAYSAAGINITKVVKESLKLNLSLTKTKFAFEAIYKSVASKFFSLLTKQSDVFRKKLYDNMPKILAVLERFVGAIFKAFEATTQLGLRVWSILERVYDFFEKLDKATDGWSTIILGVIAAWKFLNLAFLATPLGMIITGFTTLLALWDDFKTFQEGGKSLINWGSDMTKMIVGITAAIAGLSAAIVALATVYSLWTNAAKVATITQAALNLVMSLNPIGLVIAGVSTLVGLLVLLDSKWKVFGGSVTSFFTNLGGGLLNFAGGGGTGQLSNLVPSYQPLGNRYQNSQSSQTVNQQTSINVSGVPDANAAASAVSGEQSKVNFDLVRNMKGPIKAGGIFSGH